MSTPQRPKVLYVMGAGRSGSTILGVTLGNCESVFYAGELDAWLARSGEPQLGGEARTRFWAGVRERVPEARELYGREAQRTLERSLALLRVHRWPARRRLRGPYRRVAQRLYEEIWRATRAQLIVDTSHYPLRARELQALEGVELYIVYLIRDPQSVVASFNRTDVAQYSKSTLTANAYLWITNMLCVPVFQRQPRERRLVVRYEDFVASPARAVERIRHMTGLDGGAPDMSALRTGIPFQGNRLIKSEVIALQGETYRPERRSLLTAALQGPWARPLARLQPAATALDGEHAYALRD